MQTCYDSKMAGHFGFVKTLHLIKRQFWWPSLKKYIESYITSCLVCTAAKSLQGKLPSLLQSVCEPSAPWREIFIDFIVELPESTGNTVIWVVLDLFSKQVHFIPCQKIQTEAKALAKMFLHHVYHLHGAHRGLFQTLGSNSLQSFGGRS